MKRLVNKSNFSWKRTRSLYNEKELEREQVTPKKKRIYINKYILVIYYYWKVNKFLGCAKNFNF